MAEESSDDEYERSNIPYMVNYESDEDIIKSYDDEYHIKSMEKEKDSSEEIKEAGITQYKYLEELDLINKTVMKSLDEDKESKEKKKKPVIKEDTVYKPITENMMKNLLHQTQSKQHDRQVEKNETVSKTLFNTVTQLAKIMEGVQKMVTTLADVSRNNVEAEKLRLQYLEANKNIQITKELEKSNPDHSYEPLEDKNKKRKSENSIETINTKKRSEKIEQINLNKDVELLKKVVGNEFLHNKINIKREYRLTQKSNFDLWMDYLKSDLTSNDLLDVIDSGIPGPDNISEIISIKRKNLVRDIIINHLDENYHKKILNESDPRDILKKLRGHRKLNDRTSPPKAGEV